MSSNQEKKNESQTADKTIAAHEKIGEGVKKVVDEEKNEKASNTIEKVIDYSGSKNDSSSQVLDVNSKIDNISSKMETNIQDGAENLTLKVADKIADKVQDKVFVRNVIGFVLFAFCLQNFFLVDFFYCLLHCWDAFK
jgi:hypothetical protein